MSSGVARVSRDPGDMQVASSMLVGTGSVQAGPSDQLHQI